MIFDFYRQFKEDNKYKKIIGDDYMIMEYKCPIETEKFQLLAEWNFITYVISGRKDWLLPDKVVEIKAGDALFLRKGVYTTRQYFEEDHCVLVFFVSDNFIRKFIRENKSIIEPRNGEIIPDQIFEIDVNEVLRSLFYSVYNYLKMETNDIPKDLVEIKFKELFFNLVLNPANRKLTSFLSSLSRTSETNLEHVMLNNFQHDLQMEDFARLCGRSLSAFKRDFKNFYQQSPGKWLMDKRLEYARALLISSDLNVSEVCFESGFKNAAHFNKAFKDKYQLPPNQFRLKNITV